ncbi:DUF1343 domain-containing protein [candidate division KSB1 bacterium]|nr:DUF1343 domain-containing protein [candidate division KSB1 bacterium]
MISSLLIVLILQFFITTLCAGNKDVVKPGIDVLIARQFDVLKGKRIGLITNNTGVTRDLVSTIDVLSQAKDVQLVALFGPEHGVRGNVFAGYKIDNYTDKKTGLPVYSLYGKTRRPTDDMLQGIDVLVYDIQDAGYRAYTYIYTMAYAMEAAAKKNLQFVVLDRPNPIGADFIEGPVLEEQYSSFIGLYPIPYIYGLTVGELAQFFNKEYDINCNLTIVPMEGYNRSMRFEDTGLQWIPTSPHIPRANSAIFAATLGNVGELHKVSEGVGYTQPFELIGETWVDPDTFAAEMNSRKLPGVIFRPCYFRPYYFINKDKELGGVQIHITDYSTFSPIRVQLHLMHALLKLYPEHNIFENVADGRMSMYLKAMGTKTVSDGLLAGKTPEEIMNAWQPDVENFKKKRAKYLIYN